MRSRGMGLLDFGGSKQAVVVAVAVNKSSLNRYWATEKQEEEIFWQPSLEACALALLSLLSGRLRLVPAHFFCSFVLVQLAG